MSEVVGFVLETGAILQLRHGADKFIPLVVLDPMPEDSPTFRGARYDPVNRRCIAANDNYRPGECVHSGGKFVPEVILSMLARSDQTMPRKQRSLAETWLEEGKRRKPRTVSFEVV